MSGLGGTEAGPAGTSRSEATIRKVVKIPKEEELIFDGKGLHQFLDLFEMVAVNEGAEDYDKVKQVKFFYKGRDLKEEVMEMEGWRELYWGKLVKEMKARLGRYRSAPRYTIQELWTAVDGWEKKGGVSSKGDYKEMRHALSSGGLFPRSCRRWPKSGSSRGRRWWRIGQVGTHRPL
ncbi:hypothetical protein PPACK8108_LOCUS25389 [Phakopsora pachyrhizi]|uniref:Retrotransposon hot spot (RHS) protein n=1 Tax=Phakopsora pachyrhizi TaxID=170000 RepID=A0AAV0BV01_PHAPC|nr:hypothetical protein PPACK8108_LOCUS25389 [Phakopsora pachyrhizi]